MEQKSRSARKRGLFSICYLWHKLILAGSWNPRSHMWLFIMTAPHSHAYCVLSKHAFPALPPAATEAACAAALMHILYISLHMSGSQHIISVCICGTSPSSWGEVIRRSNQPVSGVSLCWMAGIVHLTWFRGKSPENQSEQTKGRNC